MDRGFPAPAVVARADGFALGPADSRHGRCSRPPTADGYIARLMRAIAAGDQSALWAFRDVANPPLRRRLRATLHRLDVPYGLEDLDGMVIDAVLAIAEVAGAWRPGGAPPWVWAHHRVVGVVHRWVGIFATSLDSLAQGDYGDALARLTSPGHAGAPSTGAEGTAFAPADVVSGGRAALQRLASDRPDAALLDAALSETVSPRDAALWLAVLDEREAGNRQPRGHGGRAFGMRPNAVRKAVQRVGRRLRERPRTTASRRWHRCPSSPGTSGASLPDTVSGCAPGGGGASGSEPTFGDDDPVEQGRTTDCGARRRRLPPGRRRRLGIEPTGAGPA
jgi:hypothetical protein